MFSAKEMGKFINSQCTRIALLSDIFMTVTEIKSIPKDGSGVTFDPAERAGPAEYIGYFNDENQLMACVDLPPGEGMAYRWSDVTILDYEGEKPLEHDHLPVAGYTAKNDAEVDLVNEGKILEERVLRYIEKVEYRLKGHVDSLEEASIRNGDPRLLAIGKTDIQKGFMMVYRAVFNPGRARLPEDDA